MTTRHLCGTPADLERHFRTAVCPGIMTDAPAGEGASSGPGSAESCQDADAGRAARGAGDAKDAAARAAEGAEAADIADNGSADCPSAVRSADSLLKPAVMTGFFPAPAA